MTVVNNYVHKVDKNEIPTYNILGVQIAAINMESVLAFTQKNLSNLSGEYMCVSNVHTTVTAYEDETYLAIQNGGIMALPDGGPLSSVGRKRGFTDMQRVTGPSYMEEIFKLSLENHYKHYFYGATEETLKRMRVMLEKDYPGIEIVGMYSPPFRPLTKSEDQTVIKHINESNPDFLWVGLGAPKQERWMAEHQGLVNGFMVGVGAGFDYFAGNIKRAPKWMQKINMEWFYRLLQEPRRLFFRYLKTNTKFIWHVIIKGR